MVEDGGGKVNTPAAEAAGDNTLLPAVADRHNLAEDRRSRAGGRRRAVGGIDLPFWWVGGGKGCVWFGCFWVRGVES